MGQKVLHTRSLPLVTRGKTQRATAAELALSRIAAREAILKPHLDILTALNQNANSEQERNTLRYCSYLLQNSSLEKLESVEIVANWYRDRTETALIASA
jgi:DNA phosphorothioation-dependent restriction protein DptG